MKIFDLIKKNIDKLPGLNSPVKQTRIISGIVYSILMILWIFCFIILYLRFIQNDIRIDVKKIVDFDNKIKKSQSVDSESASVSNHRNDAVKETLTSKDEIIIFSPIGKKIDLMDSYTMPLNLETKSISNEQIGQTDELGFYDDILNNQRYILDNNIHVSEDYSPEAEKINFENKKYKLSTENKIQLKTKKKVVRKKIKRKKIRKRKKRRKPTRRKFKKVRRKNLPKTKLKKTLDYSKTYKAKYEKKIVEKKTGILTDLNNQKNTKTGVILYYNSNNQKEILRSNIGKKTNENIIEEKLQDVNKIGNLYNYKRKTNKPVFKLYKYKSEEYDKK